MQVILLPVKMLSSLRPEGHSQECILAAVPNERWSQFAPFPNLLEVADPRPSKFPNELTHIKTILPYVDSASAVILSVE